MVSKRPIRAPRNFPQPKGAPPARTTVHTAPLSADHRTPSKETPMPSNDSQQDQTPAAATQTDDVPSSFDAKAAAANEERELAVKLAASNAEQVAAEGKQLDDELQLAAVASEGRERLLDQLRAHRNRAEEAKSAYKPPEPTARQKSQTELEMEAGRKANERHAERAPPPNPNLTPSPSTPVHRPKDFVPGINSKDPAIG